MALKLTPDLLQLNTLRIDINSNGELEIVNRTNGEVFVIDEDFIVSNNPTYSDSDTITAINNDSDHDSTAPHNFFTDSDTTSAINTDANHGSTASHNYHTSAEDYTNNSILIRNKSSGSTSASGGTWNTLEYNEVRHNKVTDASFDATNYQLTVPAGTYYFDCHHNSYNTSDVTCRMYDTTSGSVVIRGTAAYSSGTGGASMTIAGFATFSQTTTLEFQLYPRDNTSYAFGVSRDTSGTPSPAYGGKWYLEKIEQ